MRPFSLAECLLYLASFVSKSEMQPTAQSHKSTANARDRLAFDEALHRAFPELLRSYATKNCIVIGRISDAERPLAFRRDALLAAL